MLRDQELRDERSKHILDTALKLFAQRGLAATKISDIAKNAGLSHGLVYNYFTSKEEIYTILALSVDPWEKLTSITELALFNKDSNLAGDYMMLELQVQNLESIPEALKEVIKKTRDEKISPVAAIFSEGQVTDSRRLTICIVMSLFVFYRDWIHKVLGIGFDVLRGSRRSNWE